MTPHQSKVMAVLKNANGWVTINELVAETGIQNSVMHKLMQSDRFAQIEQGFDLRKVSNRHVDVKIFRLNEKKSNVSEALQLAKKHEGMFGQLFWCTK